MSVKRIMNGSTPDKVMKQTKKTYLDCYISVRLFIEPKDLDKIDSIADSWRMNLVMSAKKIEHNTNVSLKKYAFVGVDEAIVNIIYVVLRSDVARITRILFKDVVESRGIFTIKNLCVGRCCSQS